MERRHIIRIILLEAFLMFGIGLIVALFFGILLDKLILVLLFQIIHQPIPEGFFINTGAIFSTILLTLGIAGLIIIRGVYSILRTKDIDLLKSEKKGEQEPKNRILLAIVGLIFLVIGYYYALTPHGVSQAISNFFPAALCVIIGTYALFTAGSIALLKLLKNNKKYYYNTRHFISLSGMLYRMKQNAAGLSNICILSAAAIVVISAGVCLYSNGNRSINEQFPRSIQIYTEYERELSVSNAGTGMLLVNDYTQYNKAPESAVVLQEILEATAKENNTSYQNLVCLNYGNGIFELSENVLLTKATPSVANMETIPDTYILTLDEYNRFYGTSETLEENEILLFGSNEIFNYDTLVFNDRTYQIKGTADNACLTYIADYSMTLFSKLLIVVPDEKTFDAFVKNDCAFSGGITYLGFDMNDSSENIKAFTSKYSRL